jgi:hypothetical protein
VSFGGKNFVFLRMLVSFVGNFLFRSFSNHRVTGKLRPLHNQSGENYRGDKETVEEETHQESAQDNQEQAQEGQVARNVAERSSQALRPGYSASQALRVAETSYLRRLLVLPPPTA